LVAEVAVVDLSIGGFRIAKGEAFSSGAAVWIKLPGMEAREARVVWAANDQAGFAFETELHAADVDLIIQNACPKVRRITQGAGRRLFGVPQFGSR
jgi:hypothetical protein